MIFFAQTVCNHIQAQIGRFRTRAPGGQKMIFMVPAMPEKDLLAVADAIASACLKDTTLVLVLKIAAALTDAWTPEGREMVRTRDWQDARGNLTFYRNHSPRPGKCTVVVLCGFDQVTDAAGLADFHTCDPDMIWRVDMRRSFRTWMMEKLHHAGFSDYSEDDLEDFDRILKPLLTCGRGDLLRISDWLQQLDLNQVSDIPRFMLANLQPFDLPVLSSFPLRQKRKSLSLYINKSAEFFNYTLFLDARRRDKALKAVRALLAQIRMGEEPGIAMDDEDICGPYGSGEDFLEGLQNYIANDDPNDRNRLLQCDFVVIWDKILKFREQKKRETRETVRKLSGGPVEVFLTACWMTLLDFYREHKDESELTISSISITPDRFKHDIDCGDDVVENSGLAREYLGRLIGGIDSLLSQHANLHNAGGSEIVFNCEILSKEMNCRYSKTAEPALEFSVTIASDFVEKPFRRKFGWRLPEHHMYRLAVDLLSRARDAIKGLADVHKLPVYHIPYFEELLQTTSDEEIRRVLLHAIRDEGDKSGVMTNLLGGDWGHIDDPLLPQLRGLAEKYDLFIDQMASRGIFATLFGPSSSAWTECRQAYVDAFDAALSLPDISQSFLSGMLTRAFLIIKQRRPDLGDTWYADSFEPAAVATILHPAVVEMLEAQAVYLTRCFNYGVNRELGCGPEKNSFKPHIWKSYIDLADIQAPLVGLLCNEQHNLDANVRGQELIHLIGSPDDRETPLSTRLLLKYDEASGDDTSLSDTELFRETSESRLMLRLMLDYFDLHPHTRDGLSVAIFRNKDIQSVVAAVHAYLKILAKKPTARQPNRRYILHQERNRPYAISITLFTESKDEADVSLWVQQWRERWEAAETENKYALYRLCRFSLAHRIIESNEHGAFQRLISEQFEADLAFFYDFISTGSGVNVFERVEPFDVRIRELKFPILEKACCTINTPAERYRRKRVVSNRQFILGARHANLLHTLQSGTRQTGTIVVGAGDFALWRGIMDALHTKVEWVICVDPNMDERLIKTPLSESSKEREIIGFGSGVGSHGEDNYTISTERFSFADIHYRLQEAILSLYGAGSGWSRTDCEAVAQGVLHVAPELSGLSLVRATGVGDEYIRDLMAYAITRKMLRPHSPVLCDFLVSLDAYRHWFDLSEDRRRPDLLWIQVVLKEDIRFQVKMHLIECKLVEQEARHVEKARQQIDNGLKVLSTAFAPLLDKDGAGLEDEHPDRRYWWMQLHRLIASKTEVDRNQYPAVLAALERLAEGDFEIAWAASVFIFRINEKDKIERTGYWMTRVDPAMTAQVYGIGGGFVRRLLAGPEDMEIDWDALSEQGQEIIVDDEHAQPAVDDDDTPWEDEESEEEGDGTSGEIIDESVMPSVDDTSMTGESLVDPSGRQGNVGHSSDSNASQPESVSGGETQAVKAAVDQSDEAEMTTGGSGRILLGRTVSGDQPVYWEFSHPGLVNRHMLIFGSSGQGKTYAIQCILCEMSKFRQNSLIIDYTNGFLPNQLESITNEILQPKQHVIKNDPLPINPFIPQEADTGGILIKYNSNAVAKRIAGLFDSVYGLGHQQYSILHRVVMDGVDSLGKSMNLDHMLSLIEDMAEDKKYKAYAQSLLNKLRPFVLDKPFASGEKGFNWDHLFQKKDSLCNIFQLAGMDMKSSRLVTEFILWDFYGYLQAKGEKTDPKVIVLDEVQNLDHQEGSPLSKYLREGRKFGLSLILATQTMSHMKKDERDRMFQAEHKLFFKPADTELKAFADIAALATQQRADEWVRRLSSLAKGECYSIGKNFSMDGRHLVNRALKIRITALEKRDFASQSTG